ncbi:MAG: PAS domain S-box protein, partial [Methanomicrobiales archaeon]|nr:PAS domain S-box protein [Methanomicrobiales archaeon]
FGVVPFILFTGRGREEVVIEALNKGADFYLRKGCEPCAQFAELANQVRHAVTWRQVEESLVESEKRFQHVVDVVEDQTEFICRFLPDGTHVFVNDAYCRYFGMARESVIGSRFRPRMPPEERKNVSRLIASLTPENPHETIDQRIIMQDGSIRWQRWVDRAIFHADGSLIEYQSVGRDITNWKRLEEALRKSELKYRDIFENSVIGLFQTAPGGRLIDVNDALARMYGFADAAEMLTAGLDVGNPPYANPENQQEVLRILAEKGVIENYEAPHLKKDGTRFWVSITSRTIRDPDGDVLLYEGTIIDITDRKRAEEALMESERSYHGLFNTVRHAIFILDHEGKFLDVNEGAETMYDYTREEFLGRTLEFLSAPGKNDLSGVMEYIRKAFAGEPQQFEFLGMRKNKKTVPKDVRLCKGTYFGRAVVIATGMDITVQKHAAENLAATLKRTLEQKAALGKISFSPYLFSGDIYSLSARLTEVSSGVLDVERASVWLLDRKGDELKCIDLYEVLNDRHSYDDVLQRHEYLTEFDTLSKASYIDADDPFTDPHMTGYVEGYLKPNRITSKLDAMIRVSGMNLGILCFEHVDHPHHWERDEIAFACQIADQVAITLLNRDRKRAEEALRNSEIKYRALFDNSSDAILIHDMTGRVLDVNQVLCDRLGYSREEMLRMTPVDFDSPENARLVPERIRQVMTTKHQIFETCNIGKDGTRIPTEINVRIIRYEGSEACLTVGRDIRERIGAKEALRGATRKLTLLSGITHHDINNQIALLQGYLALLETTQPDISSSEYFQNSLAAANRISAMIRFAREYEGIGVRAPAWHNCRTLVDTAAKEAQLGKVMVTNVIPDGAELFADPLVVKVFYNLIGNAVRYGGKIETLRFSVKEAGDGQVLVCEDDGDGVMFFEKEEIFKRGFGKNTGMGLFLSREILAITDMTINETGEPGKGARFEITVPKGVWRMNPGTNDS